MVLIFSKDSKDTGTLIKMYWTKFLSKQSHFYCIMSAYFRFAFEFFCQVFEWKKQQHAIMQKMFYILSNNSGLWLIIGKDHTLNNTEYLDGRFGSFPFCSTEWKLIASPESIQHSPIGEDSDQSVFHCDIMQERLLGIHNEGIRNPEQLHQTAIQTQAFIAFKYQPLICPALPQKDSGSVVLHRRFSVETLLWWGT